MSKLIILILLRIECYCGNSFGKYGQLDDMLCGKPCPKSQFELCGGNNANNVWQINNF